MERLLTVEEVAEMLSVHPDTVKNQAIPFTRVGRQRRYHPRAIEKWLQDHSPRPDAWAKGAV